MSREADRKGTESKRRSPRQEISAADQLSPGREWKGLRLGALALSRLRSPRQDAGLPSGVFCGRGPASVRGGGGTSSRMAERVAWLWCCSVHSQGPTPNIP